MRTRALPGSSRPSLRWLALTALVLSACSANSAKKHYVLAEKLWTDGNYAGAVTEFEKVSASDPQGKLGLQSLLRAANTQAFFLSDYGNAIRKFRAFASQAGDTPEAWDAQKQIGEILFSKTQSYDQAIAHYLGMLKLKPDSPDSGEFLFRIGKSHFFLMQFEQALKVYQDLTASHPKSVWAEKAAFETGVVWFTRGGQSLTGETSAGGSPNGTGNEAFLKAIESYRAFIRDYPQSTLKPEAEFGIASCLAELDQLDAAYQAFEALRKVYPSPKVIEIKLVRIRERKAQRSR